MKLEKNLLKGLLLIACAMILTMAILSPYESASQGSTSADWDWALRSYLNPLMLFSAILGIVAKDRTKRLNLRWAWISFRSVCFFAAIMAWGVHATNVVDYSLTDSTLTDPIKSLLHEIFTGLLIGSYMFLAWHVWKKGTWARRWAMLAGIVGAIGFILAWRFDLYSITWGEAIPTICIGAISWAIINEQVEK